MAVGDEMVEPEGSISSRLIRSLESSQSEDTLSPEDAAWVDSCLVKNLEISDGEWSSLKDALLEILNLQAESHDSCLAPGSDASPGVADTEMSSEAVIGQSDGRTDTEFVAINEERETSNGHLLIEEADVLSSQNFLGELPETSPREIFLPNYKEDDYQRIIDHDHTSFDTGFKAYEMESSTEDIFRVWDLGIPAEEDELVKQLNKLLSERSVPSIPSALDDTGSMKDFKVDNLIAGLADLSLDRLSP